MLSQIFRSILLLSCVGGALFLILLSVKPLTKRVFGSSWQYYMWLTVLMVMVLPVTFKLPVNTPQMPEHMPPIILDNNILPMQPMLAPALQEIQSGAAKSSIMDNLNRYTPSTYDLLIYIWLSGACLFLCLGLINYWVFLRTIRKNSVPIFCPKLHDVLREKGMKNKIHVRSTDCINAPLMVGVFRATLLLPNIPLTESELRYILLHELTHLKRHDLWYKWFSMVVNAVHWFNPLVYFAVRQINEECEISCDLTVTQNMTKQEKSGYMNTILSILSESKLKKQSLSTAMASDKKQIKRRFMMIKNANKSSKFTVLVSVISAALILGVTVFASGVLANGFLNAETGIRIKNGGKTIQLHNEPFIEDEIVYIPLRETLNLFGITDENIGWRDGTITIVALPTKAEVYLGSDDCYVNDMAVRLMGKAMLKGDTTYISSDFINILKMCQADLGGGNTFDGLEVYKNDIDVTLEYASSGFSQNDISFTEVDVPTDMANAYRTKIYELYKLNTSFNEYFLYDVDSDGTYELFIGWRNKRVYTYANNEVKMLGEIYNDAYKLDDEAGIYTFGGFGTGAGGTTYYEVQNGVLVAAEGKTNLGYTYFGDNVVFRYNDEIISEKVYNSLVDKHFNQLNLLTTNSLNIETAITYGDVGLSKN